MMRQLDMFWETNKDWWHYLKSGFPVINDDAPPEAKASYEHYLEQIKTEY